MASPSPVPPYLRVVEASAWTKGANRCAVWSGRIPMPVSVMAKRTVAVRPLGVLDRRFQRYLDPCSVNLMALAAEIGQHLAQAVGIAASGASGISGDTRASIRRPLALAWTRKSWTTSSTVRRRLKLSFSRVTFRASILERSRMSSMRASRAPPAGLNHVGVLPLLRGEIGLPEAVEACQ